MEMGSLLMGGWYSLFLCESARSSSENRLSLTSLIECKGKIAYEAKGIILLYNEVGIKGDNSDIYWNMGSHDGSEDRKMPVLEMHISKNKFNSFKGRCFLKFMPEMASFMEASDEEEQSFRQMMRG